MDRTSLLTKEFDCRQLNDRSQRQKITENFIRDLLNLMPMRGTVEKALFAMGDADRAQAIESAIDVLDENTFELRKRTLNFSQDINILKSEVEKIVEDKDFAFNRIVEIINELKDQLTYRPIQRIHEIPPPPRDFTGRTEELDELLEQVNAKGVTISGIHGMGGIEKTVLAQKFAQLIEHKYIDAQFYLDLKGISPKALTRIEAMAHVIQGFEPDIELPENDQQIAGLYRSVLNDKNIILFMDNAANAKHVAPLIPPDGYFLLVTSRQHFVLEGIFTKNLNILSRKDAASFLLKISNRIGEYFERIAQLCGYLLLALGFAGSTLAVRTDLSPENYVTKLDDTQKRLKEIDKFTEYTSETLGVEGSLHLSYELLDEKLQEFWRLLPVFPNTFYENTVAEIFNINISKTQDWLNELIRFSMLDFKVENSFYSVHDLLHIFADSQLKDKEKKEIHRKHGEYFR